MSAKTAKSAAPKANTSEPAESERYRLGKSFLFPARGHQRYPHKVGARRYRMRDFPCSRKFPAGTTSPFLPGTLTRFVIEGYREKCDTKTVLGPRAKRPLVLDIPVYITGMSFGALSYEAKTRSPAAPPWRDPPPAPERAA